MLSKNQIKLIKSLSQKKFRSQHGLFTVEGVKGITEFINSSFQLNHIYTTDAIFNVDDEHFSIISDTDLKKISQLKSPNTALAVFEIPEAKSIDTSQLIVALDDVRDPGNLGTIIRLCDWFGIKDLVCSKATVDSYNSKVVQATMGSLTRVNVSYIDLENFISGFEGDIFGTFMDGENIYSANLPNQGVLIMGNEANGISRAIENLVNKRLAIPRFGTLKATESLNVATATAICLSEFKRKAI
ncbi:TrmH family RNA methyltransferase [Winogradskyella jejuensis]|uniref:RNA methyltransferase, TrmH family n=1 Tax=Winogradskyella jejuensis TaxID=1089305 RepID=A0A1M5L8S1_9FLAO|nr:RNA methyltransferase [Winogradskyella jejuensis]SHG61360.1 RNA methyltransferase, TrmH family [Winogradskyella jejuensis]